MNMSRILTVACLTLGLAAAAAADCPDKLYKVDVPDPETLKLKEGQHVIAAVDTDRGKLEARVTVKDGKVSPTRYFIGGKAMKETAESQVPKRSRDCLKGPRSSSGGFIDDAVGYALNWIVSPAYAAVCVTTVHCGGGYCSAHSCCSVRGFVRCAYYVAEY